ncbi:hypothetical protein BaOVIS_007480 [Babesia ovis]|uniref:Transmembrane protein n=1 Tax=Babesia ovis TaxID=5869 RepID=A0A9W5T8F7_BABOV|nr:hypothetical protein BaOVIS_007480 [Babesia ovis]
MRRFAKIIGRAFSSTNGVAESKSAVVDEVRPCEKSASFRRMVGERLSLSSYAELEDDFKRLSRSSKVVFAGIGSFLVVPGGFALLTVPSKAVDDLASQQFKLSSTALSWLSASTLAFNLVRFNRSARGLCLSFVGLLGPSSALIAVDHSESLGYTILLSSYALFGLGVTPYSLRSVCRSVLRRAPRRATKDIATKSSKPVLPVCVAKPVTWMVGLNMVMLVLSAIRRSAVRKELETTDNEEIIRRYEATHGIPG